MTKMSTRKNLDKNDWSNNKKSDDRSTNDENKN